jgi:uncharacterized damage-inducible protein DinB
MNIRDMLTIYDYNYWANARILAATAKLSPEQFIAPASYSYGGVRRTLVHTLDTEYGWRSIIQHGTITPDLDEAGFPTLAALEKRWDEEESAMRAYLSGLQDTDMEGLVRYTTSSGIKRERVLWHCLLHVANHGTQHRSEAAALLTSHDQSPGDLDFTVFLNERA